MDGVGTPIIGRPRPLPSHDTPNPAHNTYTLKCEEPVYGPGPRPLNTLSRKNGKWKVDVSPLFIFSVFRSTSGATTADQLCVN